MLTLESDLTNKFFVYHEMEQALGPIGFKLSDNWDYDHGYFDYKIDDQEGYLFLRLPVEVMGGFMDPPDESTMVKVKNPFLLYHQYQDSLDDHVREGNFRASFDQFQEPKNKDAEFPQEFVDAGREVLKEAEQALRTQRNKQY
ncbi:YugN family protein [Halobacillus sp. B23F22_1]|uniref:YugN family protein n=1 Tax=Halobacillus sp. B23F22_1 TaxID=3459514 RepID=UPI00373F6E39